VKETGTSGIEEKRAEKSAVPVSPRKDRYLENLSTAKLRNAIGSRSPFLAASKIIFATISVTGSSRLVSWRERSP
jgi:hypothetical protein